MPTYHIFITGPFSSGKTRFIQSVSEIDSLFAMSDSQAKNLPNFDFGLLNIASDLRLYFFSSPGARRFELDHLWASEVSDFLGLVVMVDSGRLDTWREFRSLFDGIIREIDVPCVVAANKQDHPDAWPVEDLRIALKIPEHIPVVPCVARDKESVKGVLLRLLEEVLARCED